MSSIFHALWLTTLLLLFNAISDSTCHGMPSDSSMARSEISKPEHSHGAATRAVSTATVKRTIFLWQTSGPTTSFMYDPILITLRVGLRAHMNTSIWQLDARVGVIDAETLARNKVKAGDLFVWIGVFQSRWENKLLVPFGWLRQVGATVIVYETEPRGTCALTKDEVHELWHYSWFNFDLCATSPQAPRQRYLPPGFLNIGVRANSSSNPTPAFFGKTTSKDSRLRCRKTVLVQFRNLGHPVRRVDDIWSWQDYRKIQFGDHIWLNMHKEIKFKYCSALHAIEAFRMSLLLSSNALVLSANSYPRDEAEFRDVIDFLPSSSLYDAFLRLASNRSADRFRLASRRSDLFAKRFNPVAIFKRAGVHTLLNNISSR